MFGDFDDQEQLAPPGHESDVFANAEVPAPGFAGRYYNVSWEIAGRAGAITDRKPLEMTTSWTHEDMVAVYQAIAVVDEEALISVSVRYRHMGIPIVLCTASMGVPDRGAARRYEERDDDGWPALIIECHQRALEPLQGPGRKMMEELARKNLTELLEDLKHKEELS